MGITFAVDDVTPSTELVPTCSLREHLGEALAIGGEHRRVHAEGGGDGLLSAVHLAFADHRPLVLTPDAIWLTIVRGVAHHVRRNAERLRSRLVRHGDRRVVEVEVLDYRPADPAWIAELTAAFAGALGEQVGSGPARLYVCDFSTSTAIDRTASEILLLDVYAPYGLYRGGVVCGIPEITVEGTPADWRSIRARLDVLEELELGFWTRHLATIVEQLIRAAEGAPDRAFFQRIYKPVENYGEDVVTGWVGWMYPYLGPYAKRANPLLAYEVGALLPGVRDARGQFEGPCIKPSDVPTTLGTCDVELRDHRSGHPGTVSLHFQAGVGAVEVLDNGALRPAVVWLAREGRSARREGLDRAELLSALLDRVAAEHTTEPANGASPASPFSELGVLYARFSTATIGDARLLPYDEDRRAFINSTLSHYGEYVRAVFELAGGGTVGFGSFGWLRLPTSAIFTLELLDPCAEQAGWPEPIDANDVPIVARSLAELLTWLLDRTPSELPVLETVYQAYVARYPSERPREV